MKSPLWAKGAPSWVGVTIGEDPVPVTGSRSVADGMEPSDHGVVPGAPVGTIARYSTPVPLHLAGRYLSTIMGLGGPSCSGVAAIPGYEQGRTGSRCRRSQTSICRRGRHAPSIGIGALLIWWCSCTDHALRPCVVRDAMDGIGPSRARQWHWTRPSGRSRLDYGSEGQGFESLQARQSLSFLTQREQNEAPAA